MHLKIMRELIANGGKTRGMGAKGAASFERSPADNLLSCCVETASFPAATKVAEHRDSG